ncbi:KTSC domain-containing protein [Pedobacter antarcticus]|uniref:KTSC domain-containing protein n=1 Tax=Pedobacter antarcticus TaxID=34086 RepID=UPI001C58F834|nr:KTSC domain-containing protein [Pedobacter antarcticus]
MPSTVIQRFSYNYSERILTVNFLSGNVYQYFAVPEEYYKAMLAARSKGKYFNKYIKNHFSFKHINN